MAIDNPKTVDLIEKSLDGFLVLKITDHLDWSDVNTHKYLIQEKVNSYCAYIDSGQLAQDYPDATDLKIRIEHIYFSEPPDAAKSYIKSVGDVLAGWDIAFLSRPFGAAFIPDNVPPENN